MQILRKMLNKPEQQEKPGQQGFISSVPKSVINALHIGDHVLLHAEEAHTRGEVARVRDGLDKTQADVSELQTSHRDMQQQLLKIQAEVRANKGNGGQVQTSPKAGKSENSSDLSPNAAIAKTLMANYQPGVDKVATFLEFKNFLEELKNDPSATKNERAISNFGLNAISSIVGTSTCMDIYCKTIAAIASSESGPMGAIIYSIYDDIITSKISKSNMQKLAQAAFDQIKHDQDIDVTKTIVDTCNKAYEAGLDDVNCFSIMRDGLLAISKSKYTSERDKKIAVFGLEAGLSSGRFDESANILYETVKSLSENTTEPYGKVIAETYNNLIDSGFKFKNKNYILELTMKNIKSDPDIPVSDTISLLEK
jgi:hypothetical protein